MRLKAGSWFLLIALAPMGCGSPTGTVSGTVKAGDQALPTGHITFVTENGKVVSGPITDGAYKLADVPVGNVKIAVKSFAAGPKIVNPLESSNAEKKAFNAAASKKAVFVKIAPHYGDPEQSKLTYKVEAGPQEHHIELMK